MPKQLEAHGLTAKSADDHRQARCASIIREYTREAGVRNLERRIADLCRKAAPRDRGGRDREDRIDDAQGCASGWARAASAPRRASAPSDPGVATGLALTPVGGDVLFIEATAYPGKGKLTITGQLGEVMQESAQAALSWVRSHADGARARRRTGSPSTTSTSTCRRARCRRTGPSAGITMATAIASLVRGEPVADDVAMTGEITLTGQVLPIGGMREKVLAAQRAGLERVIVPRENEPDLEELPPETRKELEFILVDSIEEVLEVAFDQPSRPQSRARSAAGAAGRPPR